MRRWWDSHERPEKRALIVAASVSLCGLILLLVAL